MDWKYEAAPLNEKTSGIAAPIPKSPILMLVYAQEEQKDTITICEQLRKDPEGMKAPILLVVGRYKMNHFHELRRRMESTTSIITHFDQEIMIQRNSCPNFNHNRVNVPVHACPMCGDVVNRNIPIQNCSEEEHTKERKDGNNYCVNCGKQLIHGI